MVSDSQRLFVSSKNVCRAPAVKLESVKINWGGGGGGGVTGSIVVD